MHLLRSTRIYGCIVYSCNIKFRLLGSTRHTIKIGFGKAHAAIVLGTVSRLQQCWNRLRHIGAAVPALTSSNNKITKKSVKLKKVVL